MWNRQLKVAYALKDSSGSFQGQKVAQNTELLELLKDLRNQVEPLLMYLQTTLRPDIKHEDVQKRWKDLAEKSAKLDAILFGLTATTEHYETIKRICDDLAAIRGLLQTTYECRRDLPALEKELKETKLQWKYKQLLEAIEKRNKTFADTLTKSETKLKELIPKLRGVT